MLKSLKPVSWTRRAQALILCFKQIVTMFICMCGQVQVRGLLAENDALLPPCGFQESSAGYQTWPQVAFTSRAISAAQTQACVLPQVEVG